MPRSARLVAAVGAAALLSTGCTWIAAGHDAARTGSNPLAGGLDAVNVHQLERTWSATVPGAAGEALSDGSRVYVRSPETESAFDLTDGAGTWSTATLAGAAGPIIVGDQVEVPTDGGTCALSSLDSSTGAIVATSTFGQPDTSGFGGFSSCTVADALAIGSTPFLSWYYFGSAPSPGCAPLQAAGLGAGIDAVNDPGGYAVRADFIAGCGAGPPPEAWPQHYSAPSAGPDTLVVAEATQVRAFPTPECRFCNPSWTKDVGATIVGPPTMVGNGDLAVATTTGTVVVIDAATGAVEWSGAVGAPLAQPLAASSTTIFAAATNGVVAAFSLTGCGASTCAPRWTATLASPASARPSIGNDVLYVGSSNGSVTAIPATGCGAPTCAKLWSAGTGSKVTGAPIIVNGRLVVGSENGSVTAFARSGG